MKKNLVLSVISITLCLLFGVAVFRTVEFVSTLILDNLTNCENSSEPQCRDAANEHPFHYERR
jgi:hypothetical protein